MCKLDIDSLFVKPLDKALYNENLKQKQYFSQRLIESFGDKEAFAQVVIFIGTAWGVIRTVATLKAPEAEEQRPKYKDKYDFAYHLWKVKGDIKEGKYKFYGTFESKICCLINWEKYNLICDSFVRKNLYAINRMKEFHFTEVCFKDNIDGAMWKNVMGDFFDNYEFSVEEYPKLDAVLCVEDPKLERIKKILRNRIRPKKS